MPIIHCADLAATLDAVQRNGDARILVTDAHEGLPVWEADLRSGICVVFGEEEAGVSAEVAAVARGSVRIPMDRGIDSLNVASAGAAVLYEVRRQRSALRP